MELRSGTIYNNHMSKQEEEEEEYERELSTNFSKWKKTINDMLYEKYCMDCDDIPDLAYFDYFVEGISVEQVFSYIEKEFFF